MRKEFVLEALADFSSLLWPCECVCCGKPDRRLCLNCRERFAECAGVPVSCPVSYRVWRKTILPGFAVTGEPAKKTGTTWAHPENTLLPCYAGTHYEPPQSTVLKAIKHGGQTSFAKIAAILLRQPLAAAIAECVNPPVLVPAPSSPANIRRRGYAHIDLLIKHATRTGWPGGANSIPVVRALRAATGRKSQAGLDAAGRARNAGLLRVTGARRRLYGRDVVLVDDTVTTGATLGEAAAALSAYGLRVCAAAVVCVAARRDAL